MGYLQVRYDSRVINYDRKLFIRLATDGLSEEENMAQLFVYRTNSQMRGGESSTSSHESNYEFALFTGT